MKQLKFLIAVTLGVGFMISGCDDAGEPFGEKLPMVVEGWIEDGEAPIVIVTHAVDLTADSASFEDIVEKWGRVSIFDGDERVVLSGSLNRDYMPSFIFTTPRLKGKPGHSYRLLIETEEETVESYAAIPAEDVSIVSLAPERVEGADSLYQIRAKVRGIDPSGCYKFFVKSRDKETRFFGSFLGSFRGSEYDDEKGFVITKGKHSAYSGQPTERYFKPGEMVTVKLCSMEEAVFEFWKVYDSQITLSDNLFFNFTGDQPTNISGGRGYWGAYNTSLRTIYISP